MTNGMLEERILFCHLKLNLNISAFQRRFVESFQHIKHKLGCLTRFSISKNLITKKGAKFNFFLKRSLRCFHSTATTAVGCIIENIKFKIQGKKILN